MAKPSQMGLTPLERQQLFFDCMRWRSGWLDPEWEANIRWGKAFPRKANEAFWISLAVLLLQASMFALFLYVAFVQVFPQPPQLP